MEVRGQFSGVISFFHHMGPKTIIQITRLSSKYLNLLNLYFLPHFYCVFVVIVVVVFETRSPHTAQVCTTSFSQFSFYFIRLLNTAQASASHVTFPMSNTRTSYSCLWPLFLPRSRDFQNETHLLFLYPSLSKIRIFVGYECAHL